MKIRARWKMRIWPDMLDPAFGCAAAHERSSGRDIHIRVREDFRSGARHGVNGTPSFFMNGVLYNGTTSVEEMLSALTGEAV